MSLSAAFLHQGFATMVRGRLRGVWVRGSLPAGRVVWAANHHAWWDPFVAATVIRSSGRDVGLVMADDQLAAFGFVRRLGVVGTTEVREAQALLEVGRVLIVYLEGELRPPGPVGPLARGAAWLASRTDSALVAASVRLVIRGQEAPEAYVDLRLIEVTADVAGTTSRLHAALGEALYQIDRAAGVEDPRLPLPGFRQVVRGRRSWDERLARLGRRR